MVGQHLTPLPQPRRRLQRREQLLLLLHHARLQPAAGRQMEGGRGGEDSR